MKINPNKKPEYFYVATSFLMTTTLHAAGIPPINVALDPDSSSNIMKIAKNQVVFVEYKIQDMIGKPPSRTWLWASPDKPYIKRVTSALGTDCSTYNQPNSDPKSFMLPPSGECHFALEVDGTAFANTSPTGTVTYRPVFSNSGAIEYGPCLSEQLQITLGPPFVPIIAVGTYTDSGSIERPLMAVSKDVGEKWEYPEVITYPIFDPDITPPSFENYGGFFGAACNSRICIAVGQGEDSSMNRTRPLLAQTTNLALSWTFPRSIFVPVFTAPNPNPWPVGSVISRLNSASCNESICIAAGYYKNNRDPILAYTQDFGQTWVYPGNVTDPIFTPMNSRPYSSNGNFNGTACSENICIAVGGYNQLPGPINRPLIVQSTDSGSNWLFPMTANNPTFVTNIFNNFSNLYSASCTGNTCVAVGNYTSQDAVQRPLLALTQDAGANWSYPEPVTNPVVTPAFDNLAGFSGVSCTGNTCVAAGSYNDGSTNRPLLAVSHDLGSNWTYSSDVTNPIFTDGNPNAFDRDGQFLSVSCTSGICVAVGNYIDDNNITRPLLAQSVDSGDNWIFPGEVNKVEFSPTNFFAFVNDGVFTNVQCNENICVASGTYVSDVPQSTPLLAQSKDKGVTWIYPNQITDVYFLPDNPYAFQDGGIFHGSAGGQNAPFLPNSLKFLKPDLTSKHARPVPLR